MRLAPLALTLGMFALTLLAQEAGRSRSGGPISFQAHTLAKDEAEQKILDVLKDMDATQRQGSMSVPEQDGRILRVLTESVGARLSLSWALPLAIPASGFAWRCGTRAASWSRSRSTAFAPPRRELISNEPAWTTWLRSWKAMQSRAGVSVLVSKWDKKQLAKYKSAEQVDVTLALVDAFKPNEKQRKGAIDIQRHKPISIRKAERIDD